MAAHHWWCHQQSPAGDRSHCSGREAFTRNAAPEETLRKVELAGRLAQLAGAAAGLWWRCTRSTRWERRVVVVPRPGVSWAQDRPTGRCRRWGRGHARHLLLDTAVAGNRCSRQVPLLASASGMGSSWARPVTAEARLLRRKKVIE